MPARWSRASRGSTRSCRTSQGIWPGSVALQCHHQCYFLCRCCSRFRRQTTHLNPCRHRCQLRRSSCAHSSPRRCCYLHWPLWLGQSLAKLGHFRSSRCSSCSSCLSFRRYLRDFRFAHSPCKSRQGPSPHGLWSLPDQRKRSEKLLAQGRAGSGVTLAWASPAEAGIRMQGGPRNATKSPGQSAPSGRQSISTQSFERREAVSSPSRSCADSRRARRARGPRQ
mmetsp:Transcript_2354/g.7275  ORF Transcript_2354/g.7275 Transcript_2354/m.7275 type:complete len:224 (+) Transcript_2354:864-1535(+)